MQQTTGSTTTTTLLQSTTQLSWQSLTPLLETQDPSTLCVATTEDQQPRLAKDETYATAVLHAWRKDVSSFHGDAKDLATVGSAFVYETILRSNNEDENTTDSTTVVMNSYLVAPSSLVAKERNNNNKEKQQERQRLPAILLFHTGAGPQDIFLRWKADVLVRELNCVVLIVDIIGDADGYAWSDNRERYNAARDNILSVTSESSDQTAATTTVLARWNLRRAIGAAIHHIKEDLDFVNGDKLAGMGWCMGGHPILELGQMMNGISGVRALISYHGVFDGVVVCDEDDDAAAASDDTSRDNPTPTTTAAATTTTQVLICNGVDDPFVQQKHVENAKQLLERKGGCHVRVLNFDKVKHGFSNPAQDFNPSDAFAFNEDAATKSWDAAIQLLKETLL
eukprot:CAMPEP_0194237694 /NCGR_PEP_ID=MMETSP0158-20130606/4623_1 /TAXON_ID=33649 /ORGANISM="Thalassionema nitzschioides, Strain L26-B" /LENGTH=394 /DNA_ID=CAMNT_0038971777 /DNA_START=224 /DNA_END=1411 /DNA_ORIENTATION=+